MEAEPNETYAYTFLLCAHPACVLVACFSGHPSQAASGHAQWVTVVDSREQAFSVEVIKGWQTHGGLFRFSSIDARAMVDMTSPDGKTNLRLGDAAIPADPRPVGRTGGARGGGITGEYFAVKYGSARFAQLCQSLKLEKSAEKKPHQVINQPGQRTTAGEATFSCTVNGTPTTAYVYAETFIVGSEPLAIWQLIGLGSFITPTDRVNETVQQLLHQYGTYAINPAWVAIQNRLNQQQAQKNMNNAFATIRETERLNQYQHMMIDNMVHEEESMDDIINGVAVKVDPSTGKKYEVPLGKGGPQWVENNSNRVVNSALAPGAGFAQLQQSDR
jgi:hypothetical protein